MLSRFWSLFAKSNRKARRARGAKSSRHVCLQLEELEERIMPAGVPVATLSGLPTTALIGEQTSFTVQFDNSSATDTGFGPYVDLYLPATGADGAGAAVDDGVTFVNATYLGQPVTATVLTLTAAGVQHPYSKDASGNPLVITIPPGFQAGDQLVVLQLPFGSFTPDQPVASINVNVAVSDLADVNTPLNIRAQGGFNFGNDALDNPTTDPSIVGSAVTSTLTPSVIRLTKTYVGPEDETATGPNYQRQYRVSVDVADGQTITNLDLTDVLANSIQYVSVASTTPGGATAISTPSTTTPGGTLTRRFASVTGTTAGTDAEMVFNFYVPLNNSTGSAVNNAITGDDTTAIDDALASGNWIPIDTRDVATTVVSNATSNDHTLTQKSIAIQKSATIVTDTGTAGATPGDTVEFTLQFQVSDYFAFQNLVVTDVFSDGLSFVAGSATLQVNDGHGVGGTTSGAFAAGNFTLTPNFSGGSDQLVFRVSDELSDRGFTANGQLAGGAIPAGGTGGGPPSSAPPLPFGPTTGTITFRTTILDAFEVDFPSGDPFLDPSDTLSNNVTIAGDLVSVADLTTPTGQSEADTSGARNSVPNVTLSKIVYAVNGVVASDPNAGYPSSVQVSPGDTVTYRLRATLPTSDIENLVLTDFLPLPILDVDNSANVTTFNAVVSATAPASGSAQFGPSDTYFGISGIVPTLSANSTSNSIAFNYGTFSDTQNRFSTIDILFTVTFGSEPFADALFLTNQVLLQANNTLISSLSETGIAQITTAEPVIINIRKGVVATDGANSAFAPTTVGPTGVTFNAPGSATPFTGTITSNGLTANPINSNLSGIDAGDRVTFAIVVENTGSSSKGAFDIRVRDTLPAGFAIPGSGLNLQVRDGTGAVIGFTNIGTGLFDATGGIELTDPGSTNPDPGAIDRFSATNGRNIAIITYDLQLASGVAPNQTLLNTATLTNYAGVENGPDHTTTDPTDTATVQTRNVVTTKSIVATSETFTSEAGVGTTANPRLVAIGEIVRYRMVVEVPEGTVANAQILDQLPSGLTFLNDGTARVAFVSDQNAFTSSNPTGATLALALGNGPLGTAPFVIGNETTINSITPTFVLPDANVGSSNSITTNADTYSTGTDVFFKLGTFVNNDRDANREYVVVEFNALLDNSVAGSNDVGENRDNNFQFNSGATTLSTSGNVRVRVVEPFLSVVKTASPLTGDAGDTINYTVQITNATGANIASAFDARVLDTLPSTLTLNTASIAVTLSGGASGTTDNSAGNTVDVTIDTIPAGATVTITYSATINANVAPQQNITNTAAVTYTSLPGTNGTTVNPTGSVVPGVPGSNTGERTGSGVAPNDLTASDPSTITVFSPALTKSLVSTSEASTAGNNATIGEIVRYRLRVRIPEASGLTNLQMVDALPSGMTFLNDGTATVAFVSNGAGITSSTLAGAGLSQTGNETTVDAIVPSFVLPGTAISGGPFASGTDVVFSLGTLSNDDRDADQEFAVVEFNALVDNAGTTPANSNDAGDSLSNTFTLNLNGTQVGSPSNAIAVAVTEPQITNVNKVVNVASADAGDVVTYTVTFSNSGTATAFDAILTDNLPAAVTLNSASVTVNTTGTVTGVDTSGTAGNNLLITFASIGVGATVTVTYQAALIATVSPGDVISNTANLTYTSLPGTNGTTTNPTGSANTGAPGSATGERNGSTGINDYLDSDPASLTVAGGSFVKTLVTTSESSTSGNNLTIGEVATYSLTVTLPEASIPSIRVIDNIPAGAAYVAGSATVNTAGFNGTLGALTVTNAGGSGDDVQFDFGATVVTDDNVTTNNSFVITYQTRVLNIAGNNGVTPPAQTTLPNTASLQVGTTTPVNSNTITTTVVEPRLTISKNIVETRADAAQTVTITLTVQNTGTSSSFDTVVRDVLDPANFVPGSVSFGTAGVQYPADFAPTINLGTGEILYSGGTVAAGSTVSFTFTAQLTNTVTPGQTVSNTAQATQATTLPGTDPGERNSPSTPSSDTLVINSNGISGFVYVDANNNSNFDGSETPLATVTITLTGTDHLGNSVNLSTQTLVDGSYSFTGLRPGNYVLSEPTQPAAFVDGTDQPGTLYGGTALPPTGDQINSIAIPLGSNATGANYNFGELPPASISNLVWEDLNGNGRQDAGEPGLDGVTVTLTGTDVNGAAVASSTTTAGGGQYAFDNLQPGTYQVTFGTLAGFVFTVQDSAVATDLTDSDASTTTGSTAAFALSVGQTDSSRDAGLYRRISVGDRVWFDQNGDGVQDASEPGIPGATVTLVNAGPDGIFGNADDINLPAVTTGTDGTWTVNNVPPGLIRATVSTLPNGATVPTFDLDGTVTANQATFNAVSGVNRTDVDFGYRGAGSIGDRIWIDADGDGAQDAGEPGLPGVTVNAVWAGFDGVPGNADDVAYSTVTDNSGNYTFANLAAGSYQVSTVAASLPVNVTPTFDLDGTATANTTAVTLTAGQVRTDVDFGYRGTASVGDTVWNDVDGNGVQNNSEPGISGATVTLTWAGPNNTLGDADDQTFTTTTDANGNYSFQGLPVSNAAGDNYRVNVTPPAVYTKPTYDLDGIATASAATFTLTPAQNRTDVDFGYRGLNTTGLGDRVFEDVNGNGLQDGGEPGIDGITVDLYDGAGTNLLASTTTAGGGLYSFIGLIPGDYQVRFGTTAGATTYQFTAPDLGANDAIDSDANAATGFSGVRTLAANVVNNDVDAGLFRPISVGDRVWYDLDVDGVQDPGEPGIPNVDVILDWAGFDGAFGTLDDVTNIATQSTSATGDYLFSNMRPGTYRVRINSTTLPNGVTSQTYDLDGLATSNQSDVTIASGQNNLDVDFGYTVPAPRDAQLGDQVWYDVNRDGFSVGEPGIANVDVSATWFGFDNIEGNSDDIVFTDTTDSIGVYGFFGIPLGDYRVAVNASTLPPALVATYDLDSGLTNPNGTTTVSLTAADPTNVAVDFGYTGQAAFGDRVWLDVDGDGLQDAGEPGLVGVTITATWGGPDGDLATTADNATLTTVTGVDGIYGFTALPAGPWRVAVTAGLPAGLTNTGDPDGTFDSQYQFTLGNNEVRQDVDFGYQGNSSISGYVYRDYSIDGIRQPAAANPESGISGVTITLTGTDIAGNTITRTAVTAADGSYSFAGLLAGDYTITETQPPYVTTPGGFYDGLDSIGTIGGVTTGTNPAKNQLAVTLGTAQNGIEYNFGENLPADPFGFVYVDLNNNGIRETGEPGISGVAVTVSGTAFAGTVLARPLTVADIPAGSLTVFTDADGRWEFPIMPPGTYTFVETQPAGYIDGLEENADTNLPATVIVGNDQFDNVVLAPNPVRGPFNFGEIASNGSISGSVYVDSNRNGTREGNEVGIAGVTITLTGTDLAGRSVVQTTTTDGSGNYSFTGLFPGTYTVTESHPSAYLDGTDTAGSLGGIAGNDVISNIVLGVNQTAVLYNFGELGLSSSAISKQSFLSTSTNTSTATSFVSYAYQAYVNSYYQYIYSYYAYVTTRNVYAYYAMVYSYYSYYYSYWSYYYSIYGRPRTSSGQATGTATAAQTANSATSATYASYASYYSYYGFYAAAYAYRTSGNRYAYSAYLYGYYAYANAYYTSLGY